MIKAGPYADITGKARSRLRMAIDDFGKSVLGKPVKLIFADHQQKADVSNVDRSTCWLDNEKVDLIVDVPTL